MLALKAEDGSHEQRRRRWPLEAGEDKKMDSDGVQHSDTT